MTDSIILFQLIVVAQICISLTLPLLIVPTQTKDPGIPLIRSQMLFLLPLDTLLVHLPPLPIPQNLLNQIMMILTLYIPSRATTLTMAG